MKGLGCHGETRHVWLQPLSSEVHREESPLRRHTGLVWIPALPLTSCVISDRLLNLSELQVSNLENQEIIPTSHSIVKMKLDNRTASGETTGYNADDVFGPASPSEPGLTNSLGLELCVAKQDCAPVLSPPDPLTRGFIQTLPKVSKEARAK